MIHIQPWETFFGGKVRGAAIVYAVPEFIWEMSDEESEMNYDLPKPPLGYKTDLALITAPYFDLWFGSRIVEQFRPAESSLS